ncbi:MAG: LarC family nickel insertion protein, partial [Geminicoccaceae bacterium]
MVSRLQVHLDPVGGLAGDMFVAAMLDAWKDQAPGLASEMVAAVRSVGLGDDVRIEHLAHRDDVLTGSRFSVCREQVGPTNSDHHHHVHWRDLRTRLMAAPLAAPIRDRAIAIFALLAEAEAGVHGVAVDDATFHEVGAWDSIADIVAAAFLIETLGVTSWSVGSLPLGSGRVRCAHGELPVPAPATVRLLEGFPFHDDGRPGERVTPTGAAILKQLAATHRPNDQPRRLIRSGHGFGLRRLEGMSNVLRVLAFEPIEDAAAADLAEWGQEQVGVISFEIDDQTAEDLAIGADHLRRIEGVLDLLQTPAFGKKGRMVTAIRLLVVPARIEQVVEACFHETTTLGVRWTIEQRYRLARKEMVTEDGIGVKLAERPTG